ncbi:MAG: Acetaldehyde dehydrogenase 2 [Paracidovorax wautersii]|uniref:Acetaldehyde dehydrogenase 2 n=1 Tax=Paracidovorax wautersii TaxID=1177982 RepID=A0A7V8FM63_9BURK|nr:MAG: Acetaldehyde dehydrogenase 2 [Paracidovorax wautersii]
MDLADIAHLGIDNPYKKQYGNYIGGQWVPPVDGQYFDNVSPIDGQVFTSVPRSNDKDIELALDAAHKARRAWGKTSVQERGNVLLRIADRIEANLKLLAVAETIDNGKPLRETLAADLPLAIDHFRYFAGVLRAQEGGISEIDENTVAYHFHEPIGVVGQIIPWNFPLLMAAWKLGPALAAGNAVVLKPAEQTPASILVLLEIIGDLLPPGVLNVVNGYGKEAGQALANSKRIGKLAFTGSTATGRAILHAAAENIIPSTVELGGKSPNIFFEDVLEAEDDYLDKALEGFSLFALNQGEVCTAPSRVLIQESIYERFIERAIRRVERIKTGHPLDLQTQIGAQASQQQLDKILGYVDIGRAEGAQVLTGGERHAPADGLGSGYYVKPTLLLGHNKLRVFQEEIFGPVAAVTTFKTEDEAYEIANDTIFGLGAGVRTRNGTRAYRAGREIQAGRVWTNSYHLYPAHAAFGGYKQSGIGRETHKVALSAYQQTKNLLVSYSPKALGFF